MTETTQEQQSEKDLSQTKNETIQPKEECKKSLLNFSNDQFNVNRRLIPEGVDASSYVLKKVFGTDRSSIMSEMITASVNALPGIHKQDRKESAMNLIMHSLEEIAPKDIIEARLAILETVLFTTGLNYLKYAEAQDRIPQAEHYLKHATKLLRLHNEVIEVLNKHRRGGEQKVIVQHVNVNQGGKAAIMTGSFEAGGGGKRNSEG